MSTDFDDISPDEEPPTLYPRWSRGSLVIMGSVALAAAFAFGWLVIRCPGPEMHPPEDTGTSPLPDSSTESVARPPHELDASSQPDSEPLREPRTQGNNADAAPDAMVDASVSPPDAMVDASVSPPDGGSISSPEPEPEPPSRWEKLRRARATRALARVRRAFRDCISIGEPPAAEIQIEVLVRSNGRLSYQSAAPPQSSAVEGCLTKTIGRLTIPPAEGVDISVSFPVKRRRAGKSGLRPRGSYHDTVEFL